MSAKTFDKPDNCPICFESMIKVDKPLETCGHWFHFECVNKMPVPVCPLCRVPFKEIPPVVHNNVVDMIELYPSDDETNDNSDDEDCDDEDEDDEDCDYTSSEYSYGDECDDEYGEYTGANNTYNYKKECKSIFNNFKHIKELNYHPSTGQVLYDFFEFDYDWLKNVLTHKFIGQHIYRSCREASLRLAMNDSYAHDKLRC